MKYLPFEFLIALLIVSCASAPEVPVTSANTLLPDTVVTNLSGGNEPMNPPTNQFAPQPDDGKLMRGNVFIQESGLLIRESFPPQVSLNFSGELPTPCHQIRAAINPPDQENKIRVDIYSVVNPNMNCTQVLKPFEENLDLGTFPSGHYTVWVNGEMIGEFDS